MPIPLLIPIARIENYFTKNIGTYENGKQFMALIVAQIDRPLTAADVDVRARKKWYAVLHTFDEDGNYQDTLSWCAGIAAVEEMKVLEAARAKVAEFMKSLGDIELRDIAIKLFEVNIDGYIFGLRKMTRDELDDDDDDDEQVLLMPTDFIFSAPWDGSYDT